jgi:hypothetical protein
MPLALHLTAAPVSCPCRCFLSPSLPLISAAASVAVSDLNSRITGRASTFNLQSTLAGPVARLSLYTPSASV